jgi:hypothetical protein
VRAQFQETENSYLEKKSTYENVAVGFERYGVRRRGLISRSETSKLSAEVNALADELSRLESMYHMTHGKAMLLDAFLLRGMPQFQI